SDDRRVTVLALYVRTDVLQTIEITEEPAPLFLIVGSGIDQRKRSAQRVFFRKHLEVFLERDHLVQGIAVSKPEIDPRLRHRHVMMSDKFAHSCLPQKVEKTRDYTQCDRAMVA